MKAKKRRKICIVGHAENWVTAPWGEDDWDILGFNPRNPSVQLSGGRVGEPFTMWAEVHQPHIMMHRHPYYVSWLSQTTLPLWVYCDGWEEALPGSVYLNAARRMDGQNDYGEYHCGSFDILVAASLVMGYEEIDIVGIDDLSGGPEPASALECLEFWLGVAVGAGVKVTVPDDARLLKRMRLEQIPGVYGRDQAEMVRYLQEPRARAIRQLGIGSMGDLANEQIKFDDHAEFASRLCEAMRIRDMDAVRLAKKTGVSEDSILDFTDPRGKWVAANDTIVRLAMKLDVRTSWLKYGSGQMEESVD